MSNLASVPVVMAFAGNDPSGGGGIQADIETIASMGCHAAPVITSLAVQDTQSVKEVVSLDPGLIAAQARAVLEDAPVAAVKIGQVGSVEAAEAIHTVLMDYPELPVILEPVLPGMPGHEAHDPELVSVIRHLLLPLARVVSANSLEARTLAPEADTLEACAMALLDRDCDMVLITGAREPSRRVVNKLYGNRRLLETFNWERLPDTFLGAGSTLASAVAGLMAQGQEPYSAIHQAQEYTWECLRAGYRVGMGLRIPNRLFWADEDEDEPG